MTGIILTKKSHTKNLFKEQYFKDFFVHKINGRNFYIVKSITNEMFLITYCGINLFEIASCTTHMITNFNLKNIVHIGFGTNYNDENDYDVLLVSNAYDQSYLFLDDQKSIENKYETNNEINDLIKKILLTANINFLLGNCYPINYDKKNVNRYIPCIYDLESCPIMTVCNFYHINCSIVKIKINKKSKIDNACSLIDKLTYNIIQEISYANLKNQKIT